MPLDPTVAQVLALSVKPACRTGSTSSAQLAQLVEATPPALLREISAGAQVHGIATYVYEALRDLPELPDDVGGSLRRLRDHTAMLHLRSIADLAYLRAALGSVGMPWIIIKGPTLAEPVHGSAQRRSYGDLDAVVPGRHLRRAITLLEEAGSTVTDRNWTLIRAEMKGEVHLELPSGTRLDLHWHLFNEPERRARFPVSMDALFERARDVPVGGQPVPTLALAETVVYVALHAMHSGGHRLIWLKDLERLLALPEANADEIIACARAWRAELVLASAVRRVELAMGAPPLAEAIREGSGSHRRWDLLSSWVWRRSPAEREDGGASRGRIVSRSVGPTQTDSFRELGRRSYRHLRGWHDSGNQTSGRLGHDDPRSDRFESGGLEEREAFLERVAEAQQDVGLSRAI